MPADSHPREPARQSSAPLLLHGAWFRGRRPAVIADAPDRSITGFLDVSQDGGDWHRTRDKQDSRKGPWGEVQAGLALRLHQRGREQRRGELDDGRRGTEGPLGARC